MSLRHRNSLTECKLFFVTTTVVKFLNIFFDENACELLLQNIKHYRKKYNFIVLGYVIMPSHFHWIVEVNKEFGTISDIMRDIKKYSAWDIMEYLSKTKYEYNEIFIESAQVYKDQKQKFWIPRFDDEVIRNEKMFWSKLNYIHNNPVKEGIVIKPEKYKYSSVRNYIYGDQSVLEVDTSFAGIEMK
ncbi:MAG: transposase [Ignavibacteriaceae bacterium]